MQSIKPIETVYNGYQFRSRLEARWAVFFDNLGIKYEYEPEGYVLRNGKWYLPDFFLPKPFGIYVEIKHTNFSGIGNCYELFCTTNRPVILCKGDPLNNDITFIANSSNDSGAGISLTDAAFDWQGTEAVLYVATNGHTLADSDWNPLFDDKDRSDHEAISFHYEYIPEAVKQLSNLIWKYRNSSKDTEFSLEYGFENPVKLAAELARSERFDIPYLRSHPSSMSWHAIISRTIQYETIDYWE